PPPIRPHRGAYKSAGLRKQSQPHAKRATRRPGLTSRHVALGNLDAHAAAARRAGPTLAHQRLDMLDVLARIRAKPPDCASAWPAPALIRQASTRAPPQRRRPAHTPAQSTLAVPAPRLAPKIRRETPLKGAHPVSWLSMHLQRVLRQHAIHTGLI